MGLRERAGIVLFMDGRLAVIDRRRAGVGRYQVLPGGGIEAGESAREAAVREAREEIGLHVELADGPPLRLRARRGVQWVFRATAVGGRFGAGDGPEYARPRGQSVQDRPGADAHRPTLVDRSEWLGLNLVPLPVAEIVLRGWSTGRWWNKPVDLTDDIELAPGRVRGGAVVIRDGAMLFIRRRIDGRVWYEVPGGGVEGDETPAQAAARELWEETRLSGVVGREIAVVYRLGARLHFFLVEAAGEFGDRALLDLEPDAELVWIDVAELPDLPLWPRRLGWRIADWYARGWPDEPVALTDSIVDLDPPCDW